MSRAHDQLERLTFFSDAVFAIAMTLLVVEVKLPHVASATDEALGQALLDLIPDYVAFLVSFLVLARFWAGHHTLMGQLRAANGRLLWANLLLLVGVAFMPFPTAVVSKYALVRTGIGFYCGWLLLVGLLNRHVVRVVAAAPELAADDIEPGVFRQHLARSWIPILIATGAFAAAMVRPLAGMAVLVVGSPLVTLFVQRHAARIGRRVRPG